MSSMAGPINRTAGPNPGDRSTISGRNPGTVFKSSIAIAQAVAW
jgi:hypothetical protein